MLESECASLRQRLDLLSQEARERERRIGRLEAETAAATQQHRDLQHAIQQQERERSECAQLVLFDEGELERKEAELNEARARVVAANAELEATKNAVVGLAAREAECRNALAVQTRRRDEARRRLEKLSAEQAEASERLAAVESAAAARRADVASLRDRLRTAEGEKEQRAERVRVLAEERRGWERETSEAHNLLVQLQSRLDSLQEIQRNYEGYQRGVRSILFGAQPEGSVLGVVADVIDVPQEYERAVAAALGDRLQYVIVRQADDGVCAVSTLRQEDSGRGSFIPLSPRQVPINGNGASQSQRQHAPLARPGAGEEPYRRVAETLLGEVVLVPDLSSGLALWRKNGVHVTMVTPDGDVIDATGVITGGSERPIEEEIVSRRRQAGELTGGISAVEERLARARAAAERVQCEMDEQENALRALDRDTHALTLEVVAAEKDLERWTASARAGSIGSRWRALSRRPRLLKRRESGAHVQAREAELAALAAERGILEAALQTCQASAADAAAGIEGVPR